MTVPTVSQPRFGRRTSTPHCTPHAEFEPVRSGSTPTCSPASATSCRSAGTKKAVSAESSGGPDSRNIWRPSHCTSSSDDGEALSELAAATRACGVSGRGAGERVERAAHVLALEAIGAGNGLRAEAARLTRLSRLHAGAADVRVVVEE